MTIRIPHHVQMSAGGASGALAAAYGAAESLRRQAPVRVILCRGQGTTSLLTGAGFGRRPFHCRSHDPRTLRGRCGGRFGVELHSSAVRSLIHFHGLGQLRRQASSDLTPSITHSNFAFRVRPLPWRAANHERVFTCARSLCVRSKKCLRPKQSSTMQRSGPMAF